MTGARSDARRFIGLAILGWFAILTSGGGFIAAMQEHEDFLEIKT